MTLNYYMITFSQFFLKQICILYFFFQTYNFPKGKHCPPSDLPPMMNSFKTIQQIITQNKSMRKGSSGMHLIRYPSQNSDNHKEDHFTYFETLQQKLLHQSDKLTNLIGMPSSHTESRSLKDSVAVHSPTHKMPPFKPKQKEEEHCQAPRPEKQATSASIFMQNYLLNKKGQLGSSKSQYFFAGKEKDNQMQRKLTYNLVRPPQQTNSEHHSNHNHEAQISPSKSQKLSENLKKTSSTTSSAVLRTIDKIKRMHSLGNKPISSTNHTKSKGPVIEDFLILKYLEEGQFGAVYLSVHLQTKFIYALKKIPKKIFEGENRFINQLVRQIKIQSFLDHPNIVQLYGFFSDEEHLYLILEPCCGGNVYSYLRKEGRFHQERVRTMVRQISHAIEFMHDSDIIHRDIKPQNILLHQQIAKVCDFGWSIHSPLLRDTRCGTPLYSSPEVVQKQQYDNKVDVWNIGILTYQLLFGRVPFEIRNEDDLVKVVDEQIYFPKALPISNDAKNFILQCLHKNPKDRLAMAKLVDHPFIQV